MKKSSRAIIIILILILIAIALYFAIPVAIKSARENAAIIEKQRIENEAIAERTRFEEEADAAFKKIVRQASFWDADVEWIEEDLDRLLNNYPETEAANKVEEFRQEYPDKLANLKATHEEQIARNEAEEKAVYDKWENHINKYCSFIDDPKSWFNRFSDEEREKIYANVIKIGDRDILLLFLPGYYEETKSETANGEYSHFYGRRGTKYSYVTSHDGIIDYLAY